VPKDSRVHRGVQVGTDRDGAVDMLRGAGFAEHITFRRARPGQLRAAVARRLRA
jgi:hypothetical protein